MRFELHNAYDGHTLMMSLCDVEARTGVAIDLAAVDQGYRGHGADALMGVTVLMSKDRQRPRKGNKLSRALRKKLKRRNAIEPTIGHLKHDHRMDRCYLKGEQGDQINALGAAMGLNLRKLLAGLGRRGRCALRVVSWWHVHQWLNALRHQFDAHAAAKLSSKMGA